MKVQYISLPPITCIICYVVHVLECLCLHNNIIIVNYENFVVKNLREIFY